MIKTHITIVILTVIMVSAVIYGIYESGSPFETRGKKFDQQRVSDITNLSYAVDTYYTKNGRLPDKLADVEQYLYGTKSSTDPETKKEYEYTESGLSGYKLCADFSTDTTKTDENSQYNYSYGYNDKYKHPKGHYCFDLNVTQSNLNTAAPPPATANSANTADTIELTKRGRDAVRLTDLANLQQAINVAIQESTASGSGILCNSGAFPCSGRSITDTRSADGTGWVKTKLTVQKAVSVPSLPVDPANTGAYHYTYCANGNVWEINGVLESAQQVSRMVSDGGDDPNKYEVGSNLNLIGKIPGCQY